MPYDKPIMNPFNLIISIISAILTVNDNQRPFNIL